MRNPGDLDYIENDQPEVAGKKPVRRLLSKSDASFARNLFCATIVNAASQTDLFAGPLPYV
jgi:hypothetical protein